jgi:hypothetical protein
MGNCGSSEEASSPGAMLSKDLDRSIKEDEKKQTKEVKLLLLGESRGPRSTPTRLITE